MIGRITGSPTAKVTSTPASAAARGPHQRAPEEKGDTRRDRHAPGYRGPAAARRRRLEGLLPEAWRPYLAPARLARALLEGALLVALFICVLFAGDLIADAILAARQVMP